VASSYNATSSHGVADDADALRVYIGLLQQIDQRRLGVAHLIVAKGDEVPFAAAMAAEVEEQHPVAVAGQHLPAVSAVTVLQDHGSAVLRGDGPAAEHQVVAGEQRDLSQRLAIVDDHAVAQRARRLGYKTHAGRDISVQQRHKRQRQQDSYHRSQDRALSC
jgi:hypothetical protein